MTNAVIDIQDVSKTYREGLIRKKTVEALKGVSFQVQKGEIFGLLGPNGAGKTTLIKVLLGIVRRTGGKAFMLDQPVGTRPIREKIGYLPESHLIPRHLTGDTALEYYGQLNGMSVADIRKNRGELLGRVGLGEWGNTPVRSYSKGMKQRLGLAQAMIHDPELIILDEPTDGVDPVGRADIRNVLREIRDRGTTVFINSHLLQEIELVCDRVAILMHGRLRHVGRVDELTSNLSDSGMVRFIVTGVEDNVREGLKEARDEFEEIELREWEELPGGRFGISLGVSEQPMIDRLVDCFRKRDVSLCEMDRHRQTLEEAFLQLVQSEEN